MNLKITPSPISGHVAIPASKSLTHRYFILASLSKGTSIIHHPLMSDDTKHTLDALKILGINISQKNTDVIIQGNNGSYVPLQNTIFLGDSGTTARLCIGLATLVKSAVVIDGSVRLRERPNQDLFAALETQGVLMQYFGKPYHLPASVTGKKLPGGMIVISGNTSSQFISSLLMIAPFAEKDTTLVIKDDLKSGSYVDLTIQAMKKFNVNVKNNNHQSFTIKNNQNYIAENLRVEGDYSSASYFIVLSFLTGTSIQIDNLNWDSCQADKKILSFIEKLGAVIEWHKNSLIIKRNGPIKSGEFDISACPDIALSMGIVGPFTEKFLILKGIKNLKHKESDRGKAIIENLTKLGAKVESGDDYIKIYRSELHSREINSFNDHRVAMSFSVLGLLLDDGIVINQAEAVSKSYPGFFEDLQSLGISAIKQ